MNQEVPIKNEGNLPENRHVGWQTRWGIPHRHRSHWKAIQGHTPSSITWRQPGADKYSPQILSYNQKNTLLKHYKVGKCQFFFQCDYI